ncbi:CLP1-P domain-containing protein [Aphelenchoides bicaudatus]|nr:CLP1-P domain-containing protein [Aphelenchoides bicaudatus]
MNTSLPKDFISLQCPLPNRYLVFLPKGGHYFAGSFRFQCLFGEVTIAGYTLKSSPFNEDSFVQFTVHNKAQMPIKFDPSTDSADANNTDLLLQRILTIMEGSASDFKKFSHHPAAILIDVDPTVVESYLTNRIGEFCKPSVLFASHRIGGDCYFVHGWYSDSVKMRMDHLHISSPDTVHNALQTARKLGNIFMITGNKNVGKSTMARYVLNYLVSNTDRKVFMLDTDIGQTEFTPPGCISLFRVDGPILTPPFLHQRKSFPNTYCIGSLSPGGKDLPQYYRGIAKAVEEFESNTDRKKFLVVNTHGWVEDRGVEIMKQIMEIVKPAYILNMVSNSVQSFDIPSLDFNQRYSQYQVVQRLNSSTCRGNHSSNVERLCYCRLFC